MNRRNFLGTIPAAMLLTPLIRPGGFVWFPEDEDFLLCTKKFELAVSRNLARLPINEAVVEIGRTFLGTQYVANALEVTGEERLVVNMRGLDCVSFYENALVLARCIKLNRMTFEEYKNQLQLIRYRGGVIKGYPSRLHYTSDYFFDNEKKGIWKNVTKELGGVPLKKTLNFMSTHPDSYRQLKENGEFQKIIAAQEREISSRETYYIPKEKVGSIAAKMQSGDIIGITTDIEGLDTSHTGIAVREEGQLAFMHAPLAGKKVEITESTLPEYLARNKRQTGIMVVRPLEPA
ncbi:MAG: N-acetylmuramoyl-L-alanine amidase-like domain-containing protein [Bacteroidota bacterium]